jgi:putative FmdB family regulatory protein
MVIELFRGVAMPIYKYICERCGAHMEIMQKVSDSPPKRCKVCRGKLEKVVSRTSFQLKGSGWYMTDYSGKSAGAEAKSGGSDEGKSEGEGRSEKKGKSESEGKSEKRRKSESVSTSAQKDSAGTGSGD